MANNHSRKFRIIPIMVAFIMLALLAQAGWQIKQAPATGPGPSGPSGLANTGSTNTVSTSQHPVSHDRAASSRVSRPGMTFLHP